jgi:hypothetical protein
MSVWYGVKEEYEAQVYSAYKTRVKHLIIFKVTLINVNI